MNPGTHLPDEPDFATIKYSSGGAQLWVACYNGPANSSDAATDLQVDNSGNVYLTGTFASSAITFGSNTLTNAGNDDIFLCYIK